MYWNSFLVWWHASGCWLIETWDVLKLREGRKNWYCENWLIETWDVLKCNWQWRPAVTCEINRNMGCIEIGLPPPCPRLLPGINRNMGCIEIAQPFRLWQDDVVINRNMGCIEMCPEAQCEAKRKQINRNMGCIEIRLPFQDIYLLRYD